eukprot:3160880-Rhodomonas_salina.1
MLLQVSLKEVKDSIEGAISLCNRYATPGTDPAYGCIDFSEHAMLGRVCPVRLCSAHVLREA